MATLAWLAAPWIAHAQVFGTGDNGVHAEQLRFEKDKNKGGGSSGGASYTAPPFSQMPAFNQMPPASIDTSTNQVPEPATLGLVAVGLVAAWAASRRRKD
jgi:PEP-CTERM motif